MVTVPEDPIEAIKKRNEERAQKLKEKIASGEFFGFGEAIDEIAETPVEQPQETASEFDLSSFPPPPETGTIPISDEDTEISLPVVESEPESLVTDGLDIEITPFPSEPEPAPTPVSTIADTDEPAGGLEIEVTPQVEQPSVSEPLMEEPEPVEVEAPPPPPEEMVAATLPADDGIEPAITTPVEITGISFDGDDFEDFPIPDAWEGETAPAVEAEPAQVTPEPEPVEEPVIAAVEPTPEPEPVEEPVIATVEPTPEPTVEEKPIEPIIPAKTEPEQLVISVDIEVQGNNVRIRRENIGMEGTIELLKRIIEKYEGS